MAEPKTDWGQELKRNLALLSQTVDRLTSGVSTLDQSVRKLDSDSASGKTWIIVLWAFVVVLLGGSALVQWWTNRDVKSEIATIATHAEKIDNVNTNLVAHSVELKEIKDGNSKLTDTVDSFGIKIASVESQVTAVERQVAGVENQIAAVKTQVAAVEKQITAVEAGLKDATAQLQKSIAEVRNSADKARSAADEAVVTLQRGTSDQRLDVLTVRAELSLENYDKAASSGTVSYFVVKIGVPVRPESVRQSRATLLTPQSDLSQAGIGTVTLRCTVPKEGESLVMVSSSKPIDEFVLVRKSSMHVELVITTTSDRASSDN